MVNRSAGFVRVLMAISVINVESPRGLPPGITESARTLIGG